MKITDIHVKTILDSRSQPTVECVLTTAKGAYEASTPSGKSTGKHEVAVSDPQKASETLGVIKERLMEQECDTIGDFDALLKELDATEDKSRLGGNLMLAISMAWARAKAADENIQLYTYLKNELISKGASIPQQLPHPIFNVINGGAHAKRKSLDFQEFQIIPTTRDFALALSVGTEYYRKLRAVLVETFGEDSLELGDEAGYSCPFASNEQALEIMHELIDSQRYPLMIGLDIAATQLFSDGVYMVDKNPLTVQELIKKYEQLLHVFPITSIEDPFQEEDFESFSAFTAKLPPATLLITDDLTTTNPKRLQKAIEKKAGNTILVKPNQIGTVSETLAVITEAYANGWQAVVSHRSGETMDDFIADLSIASGAWGIKAGAPGKPERIAKYNRILEIVQNGK